MERSIYSEERQGKLNEWDEARRRRIKRVRDVRDALYALPNGAAPAKAVTTEKQGNDDKASVLQLSPPIDDEVSLDLCWHCSSSFQNTPYFFEFYSKQY